MQWKTLPRPYSMCPLHYSVLKNEAIDNLSIKDDGVYVDATVGYAGHSKEILKRCPKGFLYGFDEDENAVKTSTEALKEIGDNFKIINDNFVNMKMVLDDMGIDKVDGIIFDLGFSSPQIDESSRGFSFMNDGPLDMRMDQRSSKTAKSIIDSYSEEALTDIFFQYGEEKMSKIIAKEIIKEKNNINTTLELVEVIKKATGANYFFKNHPERKIFQALRIEVNSELEVLEKVLPDAINMLKSKGRICVITFHSLEDKIVKKIFKKYSEVDDLVKGLPEIPDEYKPLIKLVNTKPILPSDKELLENTRSHSAKLRVIERI